jgi:thioredoxin reductase (NADPH)
MAMSDIYEDRRAQMFPKLDPAQIARIAKVAEKRATRAGEVLFEQGQPGQNVHIVLSGSIEVVRPTIGAEDAITTHEAGEFTGEVNVLSGRRSLVLGRVKAAGEVLVLDSDKLRRLVQSDSELSDLFLRAFILRRMGLVAHGQGDAVLLGSTHSAGTLRLQEFFTRNAHPYTYLDVERDSSVQAFLDRFRVTVDEVPVVICRGEKVLRNPTIEEVAACFGLSPAIDETALRDVVVVGAGPAGLAAAVYGASEGLDVLVIEADAPGGQAGTSSKIENYLGFPTGISGQALASRAFTQAEKFGADIAIARTAVRFVCSGARGYEIVLADGSRVRARTIIIASGVQYRRPPIDNLARFENLGVYYGATKVEELLCAGEEVIVVGGGNSAGQAAVFLAAHARHVHMLVRSSGLADTMSRYLIRRIEDNANITLRTRTEITALEGGDRLEGVVWRGPDGAIERRPIAHVFMMTGAVPNTAWLEGCVALDDKGFVKTGTDLTVDEMRAAQWAVARAPYLFETCRHGVFAVGDVRAGSVKRVASAVGEGSICVQLVHRVLAE